MNALILEVDVEPRLNCCIVEVDFINVKLCIEKLLITLKPLK